MSPVSRKRKPKKQRKGAKRTVPPGAMLGVPPRHRSGGFAVFNPKPFHERWFAEESARLVDEAQRDWESWYDAAELHDLEDRACRGTGEVLLRRSESDYSSGNSFNPWLGHLSKTAAERAIRLLRAGDDSWRGPACLLIGLAAIRHEGVKAQVDTAMSRLRKALDRQERPEALAGIAAERIEPTDRAWTAVDAYGDRFALVVQTRSEQGDDAHFYLVAVEMAADNVATFAGEYWMLDDALAAWRAQVGPSATEAEPRPVESGEDLWFLMYLGDPGDIAWDLDKRPIFREYFRAQRRLEDLVAHFRKRGMEIPDPVDLIFPDVEPHFEPFMAWMGERHADLDEDAIGEYVYAIIGEWLVDTAPPTTYSVSPPRVKSRSMTTLETYIETDGFKDLMSEWVRYCAAQTGLDEALIEAAVAAVPANREEAMKFETDIEPPAEDA